MQDIQVMDCVFSIGRVWTRLYPLLLRYLQNAETSSSLIPLSFLYLLMSSVGWEWMWYL